MKEHTGNKSGTWRQEKLHLKSTGDTSIQQVNMLADSQKYAVGVFLSQLQTSPPRGPGEQHPPPALGKTSHQALGDEPCYTSKMASNAMPKKRLTAREHRLTNSDTLKNSMHRKLNH